MELNNFISNSIASVKCLNFHESEVTPINCTLNGSYSTPAQVTVTNDATLTLNSGASLNINFASTRLFISAGSKVVVIPLAKIYHST